MSDDPGLTVSVSFSGNSNGNHGSFGHGEEESPFFADITLDLAEAHDIAETPEPNRKTLVESGYLRDIPKMPPIPDRVPETSSFPFAQAAGMTAATESIHFDFDDTGTGTGTGSDSKPFASISNRPPAATTGAPFHNRTQLTPSTRRWPRDVQWAVAFCVIVPLSLLLPLLFGPTNSQTWIATAPAPRLATLHTLLWGYAAAFVLARLLYRTMGGGDGDDARHVASQVLLASAPISVSVYFLLVLTMYVFLPHAMLFLLIPLWYLARDIFLFRTWKITATTPGGRQAFFQALACMTLDILSRSLRRSSFYRMVSFLLVVQLLVIAWWRWALLAALQSQSILWIVMAAVGGKWATGTVARLLTLIAAGGIQSWFAEQDAHVREIRGNSPNGNVNGMADDDNQFQDQDEEMIEFTSFTRNGNGYEKASEVDTDEIQEAYRTADASIYKSSLVPDEGIDDDFDDEYNDRADSNSMYSKSTPRFFFRQDSQHSSTVKQLMTKGLTQNFGSVARCGLLGGVAQFTWSQLRKIDTARATFRNLQGMPIGYSQDDATSLWDKTMLKANRIAREFVRNNSDMAMSHVAAYAKSYQRAAQDVAILIDESGVEPMIHEDISTHMSSCVGGSVSGLIVMFTGIVLVHQRNRNHPQISDSAVVIDLLLAFVLCYTLIFTVMEPLRASIKAVYISFAQYPQALSQSYPLIYHRLSRMSQSNLQ